MPRDVANFEPLLREPNRLMLGILVLVHGRVRHTPGWVRANKGNVRLERGQCVLGIREIAVQLGVSKDAAQRALRELERIGLIARQAGHLGSVVSVPNYGAYGESDPTSCDDPRTQPGRSPDDGLPDGATMPDPNERVNGEKRENGERGVRARADESGETPGTLDKFTALYEHKRAVIERHGAAGAVLDRGVMAERHLIRETLNRPELAGQGLADYKRALDMLGIQAQAKHDAGEPDPWSLLRNAWHPKVLLDAMGMPDEKTARARAVRGSQSTNNKHAALLTSVKPASAEDFARYDEQG